MPSLSQAVSTFVMVAAATAVIFRVDMIRGVVTGLNITEAGKAAPATARILYM